MLLTFLTIVGVRPVLTHVVLLDEEGIHGEGGIDGEGDEGHLGALLHDLCVIDGIVGRGAPGEGTVVLDEHGGRVVWVDFADVKNLIHNDITCLQFILSFNLFLRHVARAGDVLVEIVGVGRADVGNVLACLCESGGVGGVGMDHTLNVGESLIEDKVSGCGQRLGYWGKHGRGQGVWGCRKKD